jgi:HD-GYP domain-containing protein (c-di-GMP phosphodiesterase class II)
MLVRCLVPPQAPALPPLPDVTVEVTRQPVQAATLAPDAPLIVLVAPGAPAAGLAALAERAALLLLGQRADWPEALLARSAGLLPPDAPPALVEALLRAARRTAVALAEVQRRQDEAQELTRIGAALSTERDLGALLTSILRQARRLAHADAGSLYLVQHDAERRPQALRFTLAQNHTLPDLPFHAATVPLDATSLAGAVATSGRTLVLDDVYALPGDVPYRFNRAFDEAVGYRTRSVLVLPLVTPRDEVVGVLQLINRKRDADARLPDAAAVEAQVLPFDAHRVGLVTALASLAAVAIETRQLTEEIERLFEGLVTAAVHAIEQRDPVTSGHSLRVTAYTLGLADALAQGRGQGRYASVRVDEAQRRALRYACLLHDFGKVAVREAVLRKERKLYPAQLDAIRARLALLRADADLAAERARVAMWRTRGAADAAAEAAIEADREARHAALDAMLALVLAANEPTPITGPVVDGLAALAAEPARDASGAPRPLLDAAELAALSLTRGTLDDAERREIEAHAQHSYDFLQRIPWTRELRDVPAIAWGHHERLDGRGYPRGLAGEAIPLPTRLMTIADLFDALVAADRPYKKALPVARALDILRAEAAGGALDADLVETFIVAEVWRSAPLNGADGPLVS